MSQLFVEALVLAAVAAPAGLMAADRALAWGIEGANSAAGGAPFWMTPGLKLSTILYAGGLAVVSAAHAVSSAGVESHASARAAAPGEPGQRWSHAAFRPRLDRRDDRPGGADGHRHPGRPREREPDDAQGADAAHSFQAGEYLAARIDVGRPFEGETTPAFEERRAQTFEALATRIAQEPGVVAVTYTDQPVGSGAGRFARSRVFPGAKPAYNGGFRASAVDPGFFEAFDRPMVAGRAFNRGDIDCPAPEPSSSTRRSRARSRARRDGGSPIGARMRFAVPPGGDDEVVGRPARGVGAVGRDRRRRARLRPGP